MSNTLVTQDTINRIGHTVIDGVKVVQYTCSIPSDNPSAMKIVVSKLNESLYKANRDICRADLAEFEDSAYIMQDNYIAQLAATSEE